MILLFLSSSFLQYCIVVNTISKLNNLGKSKRLVLLGAVEVSTFLLAFFFLVQHYGTLGAAISTLIAFIAASVPSLMWSQRTLIKEIISVEIPLVGDIGAVYMIGTLVDLHPLAAIRISAGLTMMILFKLKTISAHELLRIFKTLIKSGYFKSLLSITSSIVKILEKKEEKGSVRESRAESAYFTVIVPFIDGWKVST